MLEIHTLVELSTYLDEHRSLKDVVVQSVDVSSIVEAVVAAKIENTVFLGCQIPDDALCSLVKLGAHIFPTLTGLPFNPYQPVLYNAKSLFNGFDSNDPCSYCKTLDARVYQYWRQTGRANPATISNALARRLHDMAMTDAIDDFVKSYAAPQKIVGMMGGHSMKRSDSSYLKAATISRDLTRRGYLMVSGGGPGAMEATHVGAWFVDRTDDELRDAVNHLAKAPSYKDKRWLAAAFEVMKCYPVQKGNSHFSLGIPTWLYGHEPPTPFASHIAKYFANSVREDGLVTIASAGLIFAPGSAGTIQEIFQDAAQNHYATTGAFSPMVFLDTAYWTKEKPIYPLVKELASDKPYHELVAIFDDAAMVVNFIENNPPRKSDNKHWSFCSEHCSEA